jgi:Family of unknown function (DUF6069)
MVYGTPDLPDRSRGYGNVPAKGRIIDATRLWVGGLMAGLVAAGVSVVGLLLARGILDVPVLVQDGSGQLVDADMVWYAVVSFLAAALATGLLHLLLLSAPRPYQFFGWLWGLAVAIALLVPFATSAELSSKIATGALNLAIGACIGIIVSSVGHSAARVLDEPPSGY